MLLVFWREWRQTAEVGEFVELEELGIGEQSQVFIVEGGLLLLLLLLGLVIRRGNRVQVIEVLREVGHATPIVVGHDEGFPVFSGTIS